MSCSIDVGVASTGRVINDIVYLRIRTSFQILLLFISIAS